uniref:Transmembrane protein 14C n=1 Tax=Strigamia maritima TaxID=126957 RepID=T1JHK9_STRMM
MQIDVISFSFAAALAFGGFMGYYKAGSTQSLYSGLFLGGLMSYGAYQTSHDPQNVCFSLVTSIGTAGLMGQRYMQTGKIMPAGVVAVLSLVMAARFGLRLINVKTP